MRGRKLTALLLLVILAIGCMISVPVLSGENPWDSDVKTGTTQPGTVPDSLRDTTIVIDDSSGSPPLGGWSQFVMFSLAYLLNGRIAGIL